jgi:electron transfer flavoprotein alpha subunit
LWTTTTARSIGQMLSSALAVAWILRPTASRDALCASLDAELAATRPVTDAGWLPHARQVGVTARSIAPKLYIAIGISGRSNHMVGVSRAATVLAINNDPAAEVFGQCDVGIVGDWRDVVPMLVDEMSRRTSS